MRELNFQNGARKYRDWALKNVNVRKKPRNIAPPGNSLLKYTLDRGAEKYIHERGIYI